jgi:dipeptidyl aminopeptidase/acylaminoacyl peptidase
MKAIGGCALLLWCPFLLGAEPPAVEHRPVVIWSEGTRMAGELYVPKSRPKGDNLPAIVLCCGLGGSKSDRSMVAMANLLAENGYVALTFDYRGWAESDSALVLKDKMPKPDARGEVTIRALAPRRVIDPIDQTLDIRHAIDWLLGEPGVDPQRIALWGTSFGGGLVIWTALQDRRVACVVAQVPGMGSPTEAALKRMQQRATQQARGDIAPVPQDYDSAGRPNWGYFNLAKMRDYRPVAMADRIAAPLLIIDAENEELFDRRQNGGKVYEAVKAKTQVPVQYHVIKGITHYGVYREGFGEASKLAVQWFNEHLKKK